MAIDFWAAAHYGRSMVKQHLAVHSKWIRKGIFMTLSTGIRVVLVSTAIACGLGIAVGQSTFGTVLGSVQDPSGSAVAGGVVTIRNTDTDARRSTLTDPNGNYNVPNLEPGNYEVTFEAPGFQRTLARVELLARQTARIDGHLPVANQTETVNVEATGAAVINTEVSNLAETKQGR